MEKLAASTASTSSTSSTFSTSSGSRRVIFIDLGRALAVAFMLYGHTVSALLAPAYQQGAWFDVWQFQRGLTSSLFLLLSGFAFSIATSRHWASHLGWSPAIVRRVRRFAMFVALGYALHFPASRFVDLDDVSDQGWRSFLAVDVLQLIGVTFVAVQLLVVAVRTRRAFTIATLALAAAVMMLTPAMWAIDWVSRLPLWFAAYLSPTTGSLFPLFPWAGFVLLGAGLGQLYGRWGASDLAQYANRGLLVPGAVLVSLSFGARAATGLFGSGPAAIVPAEVLVRAGVCLIILGGIAHLSRRITRLPRVFGAVAQESLLIYFVHLCIVYGSVWNDGLVRQYGPTLTPMQIVIVVISLILSMVVLAWYWNWWKHARPRAARWTMAIVWAVLVYRLL